jgi:hypothetical protein
VPRTMMPLATTPTASTSPSAYVTASRSAAA